MGKVFADKETPLVPIENIFALISWKETLMRRTHTDSISMSCIHYTLYLYAHCAFLHTGSMGVLINVLKGAGLSWGSVLQANENIFWGVTNGKLWQVEQEMIKQNRVPRM